MRSACGLALLLPLASAAHAAEAPALPNPILTPGAIDPAATLDVICNGTTRDRRHVTAAEKNAALDAYSIPSAQAAYYEIDHLIPLAIGGANTIANLGRSRGPRSTGRTSSRSSFSGSSATAS